jgi:hypothetical protein
MSALEGYSEIGHTHDYATVDHNHDGVYAKLGDVLKQDDLTDYATQDWVKEQGYLTGSGSVDTSEFVTETELAGMGYATQDWVGEQGYLKQDDLTDYALKSDVPTDYLKQDDLAGMGYATESWVGEQGYLTADDLNKYALQTYVEGEIARIDGLIGEATIITNNILS